MDTGQLPYASVYASNRELQSYKSEGVDSPVTMQSKSVPVMKIGHVETYTDTKRIGLSVSLLRPKIPVSGVSERLA